MIKYLKANLLCSNRVNFAFDGAVLIVRRSR